MTGPQPGASESGFEQEEMGGNGEKGVYLGNDLSFLPFLLLEFSCPGHQSAMSRGPENTECGIHGWEIFSTKQDFALLWHGYLQFGNLVLDRVEGNEMRPPCLLASAYGYSADDRKGFRAPGYEEARSQLGV